MQQPLHAMDGFTFGCDPELFILDRDENPVSAEGLIPGTKLEPYKVEDGAVQVDGMAAEINIDPAVTFEEFNGRIVNVLKQLKAMLPTGYKLSPVPSMSFSNKVWDATPDIAKALGCTPDFNAWTGTTNPPPDVSESSTVRCAGGHLHIGWTSGEDDLDVQHISNCRDLVRQLDWYLGAWSLQHDKDKIRRSLYGKAGACRYKPYGVEYRVLSNFWLGHKNLRVAVWNRMQAAIKAMRSCYYPDKASGRDNMRLIESINNSELNVLLTKQFYFPIIAAQ